MIVRTRELVESRYCVANGYSHDAKVIYMDTDSIMVRFGACSLEESLRLGREAAEYVSDQFPSFFTLAFETVRSIMEY